MHLALLFLLNKKKKLRLPEGRRFVHVHSRAGSLHCLVTAVFPRQTPAVLSLPQGFGFSVTCMGGAESLSGFSLKHAARLLTKGPSMVF